VRRWYVAHTQPQAEVKAAGHLRNQGFETYLPRYLKRRSHARRIDHVPAPLFTRYLFIAIDLETERWRAVRSTVGVHDLVLNGDLPAPVPRGIVEDIKSREDARGYIRLLPRLALAQGDRVEVTDGPLCGASGLFECAADEERVVVLLDLLGRQVRTCVPLETVRLSA